MNDTAESLRNIDQAFADMQAMLKVYRPICHVLLPIRKQRLMEGVPLDDMQYILYVEDWPDQYKAGVNRCCGFDILWHSRRQLPVTKTIDIDARGIPAAMRSG